MINELENNFNKFNLKQYDLKNIFESNFKIVIIDSNNKTFVNFYYCCLVKSTNHVKGIMRIDSKNLIFTKEYNEDLKNNLKDPNFDIDKGTCFGSFFISRKSNKDLIKFTIKLKNIKMILLKNYYYKNTAIEIFTKNRKSYFFQFKTKEDLNKAITDIKNNIELINEEEVEINNIENQANNLEEINTNIHQQQSQSSVNNQLLCKVPSKEEIIKVENDLKKRLTKFRLYSEHLSSFKNPKESINLRYLYM